MGRTLAACALPALVVAASWLRAEEPRVVREAFAVAALAVVPALVPWRWLRAVTAAAAGLGAVWVAFGAQPWELLPFRDERVVGPVVESARRGIEDFYAVYLPLEPARNPEMHALVLIAIFVFTLAVSLLAATRRPLAAAAVTVAAAGWPATILGGREVAVGALALAAALSIPLALRVRSGPALAVGGTAALGVVLGAAWASSATTVVRDAALNWEAWNVRGAAPPATSVRFVWNSNYEGIRFPATQTVVLTIRGPDQARYWRASTLDLFTGNHWLEDHLWLGRVESTEPLELSPLTPSRARRPDNWIEQRVEVKALVDDHLAAAGTPVALDARRLGTVFLLSDSVLRVRDPLGKGASYRVWSYVPEAARASLAAAPARYPASAARYLEVDGREMPPFAAPNRSEAMRALFADPSYADFTRYRPLYDAARRVAGRARTPYDAVLALESWLRYRGGFRYDESPPRLKGLPLVTFLTRTKAGYCQHFAGAMAAMLRMLGIPARVAVGFTSGRKKDDAWIVTDHDAHAWVDVWFRGQGWVPFDPTPGRGTFSGDYSFASDSEAAVAALRRGDRGRSRVDPNTLPDAADLLPTPTSSQRQAPSLFALVLLAAVLGALVVGLGKLGVRRARYLRRDPRRIATATRRELEAFLRDQGVAMPPGATLETLRRAVREKLGLDGAAFLRAAAGARFGPPEGATGHARAARDELRVLLDRARAQLSVWDRARGFVSLRSLRGSWQE